MHNVCNKLNAACVQSAYILHIFGIHSTLYYLHSSCTSLAHVPKYQHVAHKQYTCLRDAGHMYDKSICKQLVCATHMQHTLHFCKGNNSLMQPRKHHFKIQ